MTDYIAPTLTDMEREALSFAFFDRQFEINKWRDLAGTKRHGTQILSGWEDITPIYQAERNAKLREAMISLDRFGLIEGYYTQSTPSKERIFKIESDGSMWTTATGWRYKLTDSGLVALKRFRASWYKCCDGCVKLPCVCRERTFCAEHGGGCHGTHD